MTLFGILFALLSVFFAWLAIRDYLQKGRKLNPARKTWVMISIIFAMVSIGQATLANWFSN